MLTATLAALTERYRKREISPVESTRAVLAQIERTEPTLNAFVLREDAQRVLAQASASEERWSRGAPIGPLDGVPITVKDAIHVKGWPMRAGSRTTSPAPCEADAPAVARAREAGAIILGKTTTPEFGWKAVTDSPLSGVSRNPWHTQMTPGGSSGGAAAAVAAHAAYASIGTDAGGSVRIPAAFCGLVALKATRGRIPAFPPSAVWTAGHIGPIGKSVEDIALLLDVMAQPDARDWNALPPPAEKYRGALGRSVKGLRVAFSPALGHAKVDPQVASLVARAANRFAELGASVEEVREPLPDARDAFRTYFHAGLSHALRGLTEEQVGLLDPGLVRVLEAGRQIGREQFLDAYDFQIRISREARLFHQRFDVLLTPTTAVPPFPVGQNVPRGYDSANWLEWSPFTYPFNLSGQPALSINCGFTSETLPVGLQIVGDFYCEATVLRAALAYEASEACASKQLPISGGRESSELLTGGA